MSGGRRVLLIGRGPLPTDSATVVGFSQLRTRCFRDALIGEGHAVRLILLVPDAAEASAPAQWAGEILVTEEGPDWLHRIQSLADGADLIVSAGPYNPGRAACLVAQEQPVWADLPGDPFAELNALALASQTPLPTARIAAAEAAALPVLARADALSVISHPQRHAALGELGIVGRLGSPETMPDVHVVPIAYDFGDTAFAPRPRAPGSPLVIALAGAFNPWFDDRTLVRGLALAMRERDDIRMRVTGGGLPGFYTDGYARFEKWCEDGPWSDRIDRCGWVPHGQLRDTLNTAHIGICLDHPGPEPELGSRTRLLFFIAMGLLPVATAICALSREMEEAGELVAIPPQSPEALAAAICRLAEEGYDPGVVTRAQARLAADYAPESVTGPLRAWSHAPARRQPGQLPAATLAAELAEGRDALARIHRSPTWKTLSRLHRFVRWN